MAAKYDHWVCISDDDLAWIEDLDLTLDATKDELVDVINELREVILDGLETA
jgi:hypothetical protein